MRRAVDDETDEVNRTGAKENRRGSKTLPFYKVVAGGLSYSYYKNPICKTLVVRTDARCRKIDTANACL